MGFFMGGLLGFAGRFFRCALYARLFSSRKHRGHRGPQRATEKDKKKTRRTPGTIESRHRDSNPAPRSFFAFLRVLCGPLCPLCFRLFLNKSGANQSPLREWSETVSTPASTSTAP